MFSKNIKIKMTPARSARVTVCNKPACRREQMQWVGPGLPVEERVGLWTGEILATTKKEAAA
jgi:hypothetical protein